jgi:hypothetical protein
LPPELVDALDNLVKADLLQWRDMWFHCLLWSTGIVALGLALEGPELWHEIKHILLDRRDGRMFFVRTSHEVPPRWKVWAFVGWVLIVVGVIGEGIFEGIVSSADGKVQTFNNILLEATQREAGSAAKSAKTAHDEADAVKMETAELTIRLGNAAKQLGMVEHRVRIQGPRWKLLEDNKEAFIEAMKPFAGQQFVVVKCDISPPEQERLEQDLLNVLGKQGAGWSPGYNRWSGCTVGTLPGGGNRVIVSSTANSGVKDSARALWDTLNNKIGISTIQDESRPESRGSFSTFLGADSPWELAEKYPTAVVILVGPNPMSDLARRKSPKK